MLLKQERYARAAEAFAKAHELIGDDVAIESYWLQARYLAAKGEVDEQSVKIAERIPTEIGEKRGALLSAIATAETPEEIKAALAA